MNKIFLIFLSITLINTMTMYSNRNMNNQISEPEMENEIVEEMPEEESITDEQVEDSEGDSTTTTESSIEDDQTPETDEETEEVEEESPEEDTSVLPDMDIELTDEEKALVFKYIGKIDINYLMNLTGDGITEDENILIIEHLKERLTVEEYEEVEDLIIKFLYSLEQE